MQMRFCREHDDVHERAGRDRVAHYMLWYEHMLDTMQLQSRALRRTCLAFATILQRYESVSGAKMRLVVTTLQFSIPSWDYRSCGAFCHPA